MMETIGHFINGQQTKNTPDTRVGDVYNPATGTVARRVALASAAEVVSAIEGAKAALPAWAATPPAKRATILYKFRELLLAHMDELAVLVSREHGKTLDDARGSITRGLEVVEFACGIPNTLKGEYSAMVANGVDVYSMRQPVGVVAGITPFNFPAMVPMWMFPVALACGNTFVLKPSERDPSCPMRLAELMTEAGLPDGCLQVINGDKGAVDVLLGHEAIAAISFVGSTAVGSYIYSTGCANGKRVQALCGAKNHMVIMPDADMDQAAEAVMGAAYGSAGERCMAISVAVPVGEETADRFVEAVTPKVRALKIGPYTDPEAQMGPLITKEAKERVLSLVQSGITQGAELVVDGRDVSLQGYENGFFVGGCLFDRVTTDMDIYTQEIFGPVLSVVRQPTYENAIRLANDHDYGNGTAIFTRDGDTARDFVQQAQIGMVGVNVPIPVPVAWHSFGGWKDSLFGDHAIHGMEGVRFYTRLKTATTRWPSGIKEGAVFNFKSGSDA